MFCDRRTKRRDRSVIARVAQTFRAAAIRFVRHSDRTIERRIHIPIAGIERIENITHVVVPFVRIERGSICASVDLIPFREIRFGKIRIYRKSIGRKKELRRLTMMIGGDLRIPFEKCALQVLRFLLRRDESIAIQIKTIVRKTAVNRPRFAMFESERIRVADADRVVPRDESLVSIGVFPCNYKGYTVL